MSARNRCVAAGGASKLAPRYSPRVSSPLNSMIAARAFSTAPISTASRSGRSSVFTLSIATNTASRSRRGATPAACTPATSKMGENRGVTGSRRDPRYYPPRPPSDEHPGMTNYPSDPGADGGYRRSRRSTPSANRWLPPLDEPAQRHTFESPPPRVGSSAGQKVTVTRAAAQRSPEMVWNMYGLVHRPPTADGADKSGLTALTWPVVANFAVDAAMAVALANTLFFAARSGGSKGRVALYLLISIAPFAVIAPLIGPALDRLQHGRRVALATSFALRTLLVVLLIANYDGATGSYPSWVLYPCALGMMVLSKSFSVLRSAVTPRVLPPTIDLVRVNSRLTTFGLLGGTMVCGAVAAGAEYLFGLFYMPGALYVIVGVTIAGAALSMRIPKWVEVTAGEVPATLSYPGRSGDLRRHPEPRKATGTA